MSRHHVNLNARAWAIARRDCLIRDGFRCKAPGCGLPGKMEIHHLVGLENGGAKYDLDNLQTLCAKCHIFPKSGGRGPRSEGVQAVR